VAESQDKSVPAREPAWMPAYVASAYRRGHGTAEDLLSGEALREMTRKLLDAGDLIRQAGSPQGLVDQASGFRHILVLMALAIDDALRSSDPYDPYFAPANVDNVLKWGMDCPDAAYSGAAVRGDGYYVIRGNRRNVRYLGFQAMAGIETTANVVAEDLPLNPDGSFELVLSREQPDDVAPENWMPLSDRTSSLVVRQFFYDWENESSADLHIECTARVGDEPHSTDRGQLSAAGIASQLSALGEFVEESFKFWKDIEEGGRAQGLNIFREPAALTAMGAAAENVSVWGSWQLQDTEALLIEVAPPEALYWSVSIGNYWWETIDYANHQSSLNGHQAVLDSDGIFRAVVSSRDPGIPNWLDNAGHGTGAMIFRWLRADRHPVPNTLVIPFDEVERNLPAATRRVTPDERRRVIEGRRAGVRRRFPR
jgi:Protein of unknown function (DUF1214)